MESASDTMFNASSDTASASGMKFYRRRSDVERKLDDVYRPCLFSNPLAIRFGTSYVFYHDDESDPSLPGMHGFTLKIRSRQVMNRHDFSWHGPVWFFLAGYG